jgi:GNAT acetyltransferase-like protein
MPDSPPDAIAPDEAPQSAIRVQRWSAASNTLWNDFVATAKNGIFLFDRNYMDYHADRFTDASLLFFENDKLLAVIPASVKGDVITSHGGLTFGGVVTDERMRAGQMLNVFKALLHAFREGGARKLVYKAVPHIYHRMPAEEDLYALFRCGASLARRDISTSIPAGAAAPYTKGRKYSINKGRKARVQTERSLDYVEFMAVEEAILASRHGVRPVHTHAEMQLLAGRFPDNIKLYVARESGSILAGVIIYESDRVAHAQYIATTERGRELCALDVIVDDLLRLEFAAKSWFDFGISTEEQGRILNVGLSENKESYGGRAVMYDSYDIDLQSPAVDAFVRT